jgi:hypothetical protein
MSCPHSLFICFCEFEHIQQIFQYTTLNDKFLQNRFTSLSPIGHYTYRQVNIQQFYVLSTNYSFVLCLSENKQRILRITNSPEWFITLYLTLYCPLAIICTASLIFNDCTFCPHSVFLCFVWISEQTSFISLYRIMWLVFITYI